MINLRKRIVRDGVRRVENIEAGLFADGFNLVYFSVCRSLTF